MRVLVTAASRHGGTTSISRDVARPLQEAGHPAYVADLGEVNGLDGVDAVVLGSAVHGGRWMDPAHQLDQRELPARITSTEESQP